MASARGWISLWLGVVGWAVPVQAIEQNHLAQVWDGMVKELLDKTNELTAKIAGMNQRWSRLVRPPPEPAKPPRHRDYSSFPAGTV